MTAFATDGIDLTDHLQCVPLMGYGRRRATLLRPDRSGGSDVGEVEVGKLLKRKNGQKEDLILMALSVQAGITSHIPTHTQWKQSRKMKN